MANEKKTPTICCHHHQQQPRQQTEWKIRSNHDNQDVLFFFGSSLMFFLTIWCLLVSEQLPHTHTHKHRQIEPKIYDDGGLQIKLTEYTWLSCMYVTYILKYTVIDRSGTRIYNRQTHGSTYGCCTISKFSYNAI